MFVRHHDFAIGALKCGLNPRLAVLGLRVCGGRGRHSVRTRKNFARLACMKTGLNGDELARISRLTAPVDNNAVANGFQLYLYSFVITKSGEWAVVQQGTNPESQAALPLALRDRAGLRVRPHTAMLGKP